MTDALKSYIETKLKMIEKYMGNTVKATHCDFEIEKSVGGQHKGDIYRAEVNLRVPHDLLRVEKVEEDMYKAIDKVKDHLELVIKKHKEKLQDKHTKKQVRVVVKK